MAKTLIARRPKRLMSSQAAVNKTAYLMMAPYMIPFLILTVIPVITAIALGFTYFNMLEAPKFIGLENYARMFLDDDVFPKVLKNTLLFAIITGPVSYCISFLSAWLINEFPPAIRSFFTLAFYSPTLTGNLYFVWTYVFSGDRYGIMNSILLNLGLEDAPVQWLSDPKTMMACLIIIQLWSSFGVSFLAFIAGFQNMDRSLSEAGAIDGIHNRWQELWYITLPSMAPQLIFSAVQQIGACFSVGQIVQALAGFPTTNYAADTLLTYMLDVGTVRFEMGYASAIATFLFLMMVFVNFIITHLLRRFSAG